MNAAAATAYAETLGVCARSDCHCILIIGSVVVVVVARREEAVVVESNERKGWQRRHKKKEAPSQRERERERESTFAQDPGVVGRPMKRQNRTQTLPVISLGSASYRERERGGGGDRPKGYGRDTSGFLAYKAALIKVTTHSHGPGHPPPMRLNLSALGAPIVGGRRRREVGGGGCVSIYIEQYRFRRSAIQFSAGQS